MFENDLRELGLYFPFFGVMVHLNIIPPQKEFVKLVSRKKSSFHIIFKSKFI